MTLEGKYGYSQGDKGIPFEVRCTCGEFLTIFFVNDKCMIDFQIECVKCHFVAKASKLWAEPSDKEAPNKEDIIS